MTTPDMWTTPAATTPDSPDAGRLARAPVSSPKGLTSGEAAERLSQVGPNQVEREKAVSPLVLLVGQFKSPVIWLLVGAAAIAGVLGELVDAGAIAAIVVINALVGFFQEFRAERAVMALRAMTAPRARVLRDGRPSVISAAEVVPNDVLLLDASDVVAADAKLIEANALLLNEAALTRESAPVEKTLKAVAPDAHLAERHDSVFMGTAVANGTGQAVVLATGMKTELGKIAHLLATAQAEATPLQKRLARVSRILLYLCLGTVAAVAALGIVSGMPLMNVFLSAVSLAVAAVPHSPVARSLRR